MTVSFVVASGMSNAGRIFGIHEGLCHCRERPTVVMSESLS
jgi:hypothetical protein